MLFDYEFYINENNRFVIPEYDVNYLFSVTESDIPEMPETDESAIKIAGRDGDLVLNTTYKPISFKLIVYTDDNLSPSEKIEEKNKITAFLNSIKNSTKRLAFLSKSKKYTVKYSGNLIVTRLPKCVKFEIPLKCSEAYGTELEKKILIGAGIENSSTIKDTGCIIKIQGPAQDIAISLNDYQMEYSNVVLEGNYLEINTKNSTIKLVKPNGVITNASIYYNHEYPKIRYGNNEIKILKGINNNEQVTTEWYDLKL